MFEYWQGDGVSCVNSARKESPIATSRASLGYLASGGLVANATHCRRRARPTALRVNPYPAAARLCMR